MANTNIYPYGQGGQAADGLGIVNDLTTGGADKALSAEMGKELNKSKLGITDNDIEVINQPILDMIGVKDVDYWIVNDMGFSGWNGNLQAKTGYNIAVVKARRTVMSFKGQTVVSGLMAFWATASEPSLEDLTVDTEGNEITYSKGYYSSSTVTNRSATKDYYYLINIGTSSDITISFINGFPSEDDKQYEIKSVNGGKSFTASSLHGVDVNTMSYIRGGMTNCVNQLDPNAYIDGMWIKQNNAPIVELNEGYKMLCQEIPAGTTNIFLRGYKGHSSSNYWVHSALLDENLEFVSIKQHSWSSAALQDIYTTVPEAAKYIAVNIAGQYVPAAISDLLLMFNVNTLEGQLHYDELYAKRNDIKFDLDYEYEDGFPVNQISYENLTAVRGYNHTFEFDVPSDMKYLFWELPTSGYNTNDNNFIQYDAGGNALKTISPNNVDTLIRSSFKSGWALVMLEDGCTKISYTTQEGTNRIVTVNTMLANGSKLYLLSSRVIPHRNPRVASINGVGLNRHDKLPLEGMTICCFGDSITDFGSSDAVYGYPTRIQNNYDCACINYGRGNAHLIDYASTDPTWNTNPGSGSGDAKNVVSSQIRWCINEMTAEGITPDVAIINGGTNDCFGTVNYGSMADALASFPYTEDAIHTNFYESICYFVSKLQAAFPNIKIFLSTVTRCRGAISTDPTSHNVIVQAWNEHVYEIADALSLDVIDFWNCGIQQVPTADNPWFYSDGLHLSTKGVEAMAKLAVSEISKAFPR